MPPDDQCAAGERAVCCDLAAYAGVRIPVAALPEYRRQPGPAPGPLPASLLRHADEQTVAGLTAVFHAIHDHGLSADGFRDWGVLAAPRFVGRPTMAAALERFIAEGAWGVSPHLIPHRSLHSLSGTISQVLKIQGPNFGVGGGPGSEAEALLTAAAMLRCQRLPGVWAVLTCLDPDAAPDAAGQPAAGTHLVGLALALAPARPGWSGPRARLVAGLRPQQPLSAHGPPSPYLQLFRVEALLEALRACAGGPAGPEHAITLALDRAVRLELSRAGAPAGANGTPRGPQVARHALPCHGAEVER
jgi:hypothetical protein